jgi:hypothetical protein
METQFCYDLGFVVVAFSISHKVPHLQISFYLKLGLAYSVSIIWPCFCIILQRIK